jgi:7-cyano-7-deazaguanine synthase
VIPAAPDSVLLFSGGLDSVCIAAISRPALCVFIDYGQRPADAERRSAEKIVSILDLTLTTARLDLSDFAGGLLFSDEQQLREVPSPEWWPYRNQFLASAAAAIAFREGYGSVIVGSVLGDGDRHVDGTRAFYEALDVVMSMQEGGVHVDAPALDLTTEELVLASGLTADVLGWSVSCHRSNLPCGSCPGCWKRQRVMDNVAGKLQRNV